MLDIQQKQAGLQDVIEALSAQLGGRGPQAGREALQLQNHEQPQGPIVIPVSPDAGDSEAAASQLADSKAETSPKIAPDRQTGNTARIILTYAYLSPRCESQFDLWQRSDGW